MVTAMAFIGAHKWPYPLLETWNHEVLLGTSAGEAIVGLRNQWFQQLIGTRDATFNPLILYIPF